ncbi:hypothetical protein V494_00201 [Pseudogymnoascus sp. VKM F-4513 (FW-928)]|nr:hypothetical protein V494_00201 [Pseudogymnoascus sp. VKM F-4513 (FW-928)]
MAGKQTPYWGAINPPPEVVAQRQNSGRKGSLGNGNGSAGPNLQKDLPTEPFPRANQPPPRLDRYSLQSQAPTVSTQSPFASPVESTFRAEGLAPRPPSYQYGGEPYNKESLERRRKRASREKAEQLFGEGTAPPPAAPDVPRQGPSSYRPPQSNGDRYMESEGIRSRHARRPSEPVERARQNPEDYYREASQLNRDRGAGRKPPNIDTELGRANTTGKVATRDDNADRSNIRRGSVQARKERPEIRSAVANPQNRRRPSEAETQRRREYTSERSPLQRLEQTLDSITKEEKRARMEEAERRAREAKAGRNDQNPVRFEARQPAPVRNEPRALPEERGTRGLGITGQDERQIPSVQESMKPVAVRPPIPIVKDLSYEQKPQTQPYPEPHMEAAVPQPEVKPEVQRGKSFRERAGAFLQRSTSNRLKKDKPKNNWEVMSEEIKANKVAPVGSNFQVDDGQAQRGFSSASLGSAPANSGNRDRAAAALGGAALVGGAAVLAGGNSKRQGGNHFEAEGQSDDDSLDAGPKRGNSTRKIEQLMGNKVGTDFRRPITPHQQQLYADRLDRSEELGPDPSASRERGLGAETTEVSTVNGPRYAVPAAVAAGNYGQEQTAKGQDGHHYFSKMVHAGRGRRDPFHPGHGLYVPGEQLFEWKTAGVASLTGMLLDVKEPLPKQTEADKDKAWWEAGNTGRRRRSVAKATADAEIRQEAKDGPTGFSPRLFLKCGPLLRYCGMKKEKASQRPGDRNIPAPKEIWRGSVMIVTEDSRSKYDESVPTLRLFAQPKSLFPPPPRHFKSGADVAPEYVDPLAGQPKVGRDGKTLYVRPVEELEEEMDLSRNESDEGIFEGQRSPSASHANDSDNQVDGEMAGKVATVKGFRLHAERGVTFWRFNIEVELTDKQQRIAYKINGGPATGFWVPAVGQSMNMMFHSCNGFSMSVNSDEFSGPDPMWRDVLNTHQTQPFHAMIGGGDQIYNDCVMNQTELFADWVAIKNPVSKHNAPLTEDMQDELEEFYLNRYSMWFSQGLFGLANSQIPMVNIFDDHDIIDGFGSYPHHFMNAPVFSGLGNIAFKYYMLFQHQSSIDEGEETEPSWLIGESPGPYIKEHSRSVFMSMGAGISFLGLDCRTERGREDVLSEETYHKIMDRCHDEIVLGETKHLIVLMGVPIAYPRLVWLENILTSRVMDPVKALGRAGLFSNLLNQFDGGVEILDDLDDHWTAKSHKKERQYLIEDLQDLAADKSVRITILGGDVHLAAVGQFYSNPKLGIPKDKDHRYMPNVVSSAIVNTPPPDMMADILNKRNKIHHFDDETDESMIPIFTHDVDGKKRNNNCLLPRRNWCSIRPYNPELSPPSTPSEDRSPSPRPGILRRLSMTRRPTYRADLPMRDEPSRPPLARGGSGLLRRLSTSRGRPTEPAPGGRPGPPQRTLSLTRDFRPAALLRRLSGRQGKRYADSGGINGYGSETDSEAPYSSDDVRTPHIRGGAGEEDYFSAKHKGKQPVRNQSDDAFSFDDSPPLSTAPLPRTRGHERPPQSHRNNYMSDHVQSAEAISSPREREPPLRPFHRTPTGLSVKAAKAGREVREEDEINLEGGLEITLNVEVNQHDPAGITAPYRLLVPALFFDDAKRGGMERKKSVVQRLMGMGKEGCQTGLDPKMDIYDLTEATARTVLSDSNDYPLAHDTSTSGPAAAVTPPGLDIADVWQFVLSSRHLERFKATSFVPTGTVFGIGEGACYRVDKGEINREGGGRVLAIKYLKTTEHSSRAVDDVESRRSIETVLRELRVLTHGPIRECENIVQLIGYGSRTVGEHISLYLVAEFAAHGTLRGYLGMKRKAGEKVSVVEKIGFCSGIASGLAALHACGVAQGDVKLENTLVCETEGGGVVAKLSDFGHAILDDASRYIGTSIFNPPEVRLGKSTSMLREDHYKCDIFSYGLMVWEIVQDGKRFVDPQHKDDPITWLNGLPRNDLLRRALLATQELLPADPAKITLLQRVLDSTLRDDAADRVTIREVMKLFNLEREFVATESKKKVISSFGTSQLSTLERWSLYRADSQASTLPAPLQKRVFARLQSIMSSNPDPSILGRTLFELSMCYLYGFGVDANEEKMLESLREAASLKLPMAMGICHRMHQSYSQSVSPTLSSGHPMLEAESELQRLPNENYYSARIRRHEKLFQQSTLQMTYDLYSDNALIAEGLSFTQTDELENIIKLGNVNILSLVGKVSSLDGTHLGSLLHLAARVGSLPIVELLVNAGADVNLHWEGCGTPVTAACRGGNPEMVSFLLCNGASAKRQSGTGPSPLHWMVMFEEDELEGIIELLQGCSGEINLFSRDVVELREHSIRFVFRPIHFAVQARYYKLVEVLLKAGAATRGGILTPLDLAVSLGFPELTTLLLDHNPSSGLPSPLLHQGLSNIVQSLLQHGNQIRSQFTSTVGLVLKSIFSDINVTDEDDVTPLAHAIGDCACEVNLTPLEVLIEHGANLNMSAERVVNILARRNDGRGGRIMKLLLNSGKLTVTPMLLNQICLYGDENTLKSVLECSDIDVNAGHIQEDGSIGALHSSVLVPGNYQNILTLLDHGANVNAIFEERSALEMAIMSPIGDGDVIDLLIERGADLTSPTETTIVHVAARLASKINGSHILFHLLRHDKVRALIDIPMADRDGYAPIHLACVRVDIEAISALVEAGAEISTAVEEFDPVSLIRVLGRCPDLSPDSKKKGFDLSKYLLRAERTYLMLLDKVNPGHRRTPLHVAALIGNYERVVSLVENGADVWAGDSEKLTPLGHIHPDAMDPDFVVTDPASELFFKNSKKIFEFLQMKMIMVAGEATSLEDAKDVFFTSKEFPEEDDSPEQLVARYTRQIEDSKRDFGEAHADTISAMSKLSDAYQLFDEKYQESVALELAMFQYREANLNDNDPDLFESRSSRVRILLQAGKLEEARSYGLEVLGLAIKILGESHHCTEIARLNLSLSDAAEGKVEEALEYQKKLYETIGYTEETGFLNRDAVMMKINIAHTDCRLGRWDDAEADVKYLVGIIEFMKDDRYPDYFISLLILAQTHETHSSWDNARLIYEKLLDHAIKTRGNQSYYTIRAMSALIQLHKKLSKFKDASDAQLKLVDILKAKHGDRHLETQKVVSELAQTYENQDRLLEANVIWQQVIDVLQEMVGPTDENTLQAKHALLMNFHKRGFFEKAVTIGREIATAYKTTLGDDDPKTLSVETELAILINQTDKSGEAIELQEMALQSLEAVHGKIHDNVAKTLVNLGAMYLRDSRTIDGVAVLKRALAIYEELHGADSLEAGRCLSFLASAYVNEGRRQDSCDYHERALEVERKLRGSDKHETLYLIQCLSYDYSALGNAEKAMALQKEALEGYQNLYGEGHSDVLQALFDLASLHHQMENLEEAETLYQKSLQGRRKLLGDAHEATMNSIENLAIVYADMGRWEDVEPLAHEAYTRTLEKYGADDLKTNTARQELVSAYHFLQLWPKMEELQKIVVETLERTLGADHADTIEAMDTLSEAYSSQGKHKECEPLDIAILNYHRQALGTGDDKTLHAMGNLASTYVETEKYDEAEKLRLEMLEVHREKAGEGSEDYIDNKIKLANIYWYQGRLAEAEALELSIMEMRARTLGDDDPLTLDAMESLAKTYVKQKEFSNAETLYLRVLASQKKTAASHLDPNALTTMKYLEDIYTAQERWGDAKVYAVILLDAMKELAPINDGRGILSALSDLRRICFRLKEERDVIDGLDFLIVREMGRVGLKYGGRGQIFSTLAALKED